jgi:hypothetical protein
MLDFPQMRVMPGLINCISADRGVAMNQYHAAIALQEYFIQSAMEFWTAVSFPALYYARAL